jgi:hypothetical protein
VSVAQTSAPDADARSAYGRDIRPILSNSCYPCHGPDAAKRKAGLRLDREESARAARDGRPAIVPGDLAASELYRRITAEDPDERMPPPRSGKLLTQTQIEQIRRWIAQGARWETHWSFIPPSRPQAPEVEHREWLRNPLDAFVLAPLERHSLLPSPESERGILLRRVSFDLTGLPPTLAERDAFDNDHAPGAYERVVDRLLATPRFGERMAIGWLSAARYADTNGYQTDAPRIMWRWRDWVIDAFNRDMPFDRFTIEQLAGDLLPGATLDQKVATGFNRNHRGNAEGGIIPEEYAVEYVADRVDTTATVWLGLTLGCARCHNHKFDPIAQEEYYGVFSFFNNVPENGRAVKYGNSPPFIKTPTLAQQEEVEKLGRTLRELKQQMQDREPEVAIAQAAWEDSVHARPPFDWFDRDGLQFHAGLDDVAGDRAAEPGLMTRDGALRCVSGAVGNAIGLNGLAYLDAGDVAAFGFYDPFTLSAWINPGPGGQGTILSRAVDEQEGEGYSVVVERGKIQVNLVKRWLDDAIRVESALAVPSGDWTHVAVTYDGSRVAAGVRIYLDGKPAQTVVLLDELNQSFQTKEPLRIGAGGGRHARFVGAVDEPSVYARVLAAEEIEALATRESIAAILAIPRWRRTVGQALKVRQCFLASDAPERFQNLQARITVVAAARAALFERIPTTMVMQELPVPRTTRLLIRGQYDKPGAPVAPGVPGCLSRWPPGAKADRLGLARWLVDPANPLTARVAVNRAWQSLFGTGLVKTVDDLGAQGAAPGNQALLDWLATELVLTCWDQKKLLRKIVTSATYRQSSRLTEEARTRDPENRLLARGPRQRLTAEMIRDQALRLGGLLVERVGGPSVKPYQPPGLWNELADDDYLQDHGPSLYRRSLYTFWKRTVPPPAMVAFDAPGRETCIVRESRTNTPLQALNLLNDVTFVEAARCFGQRMITELGARADQRLEAAFRAATARRPRYEEIAILRAALADQLDRFRRDPSLARALLDVGESRYDARLDPAELAAYTSVAQLILNLDETISKE